MRHVTADGGELGFVAPGEREELPDADHLRRCKEKVTQRGEMFVWSHPFDFHYKVNELSGWYTLHDTGLR